MLNTMLSSFFATLGFGIVFNIRGKNLIYAGITGTIGSIIYYLLPKMGANIFLAMFFASIAFSSFAEYCARKCKSPVTTFVVCGLIPLVPGKGMYETMQLVIAGKTMEALTTGIETLSIAGALAIGIVFVSTTIKYYYERKCR